MLNQFKELWQSLGANQKISLILASGLVALAMIGMMIWAAQPQMDILYGRLAPEDLDKIVANLEQSGVAYEVRGGTAVYVDAGQKHKLKAALAQEGIPSGGAGKGFELFDDSSFGISDFVQKTNYLRAIQGELSRTISLFDGIESARVQVVMPENRLLSSREGQDRPTASVFVISRGALNAGSVNSIRQYVANSIPRLSANDVVVVDSQGTDLTEGLRSDGLGAGLSNDVIRYRKSIESYYTMKVQSMLDGVLGHNQSQVRVAADIDTASVQTTERTFDPESQVARSTTVEDSSQLERETAGQGAGGASGIAANGPATVGSAPGNSKEREDRNKTSNFSYELNSREVSSVQTPGSIRRLTASILVARRYTMVDGQATAQPRAAEELETLRQTILTSLPIELRPGQRAADFITVTEMDFAASPFEDHSAILRKEVNFQRYVEMGKNGLGAVLGIGVIVFFLQMLKRHKPEKISIEVLQPEQMLQSRRMEDTSAVTPEMLNELIRQKPANIGLSLREWISETESSRR